MNKNNPKVSVYIPAYNHEEYVEQAVLSIINQTFQDFELLVIDDGSTDRTPLILEQLSKQYGFYYGRQENRGVCRTLNTLAGMAKGAYLTLCASDDFWPATRLEEQISILNNEPTVDMVHSKVSFVDSTGVVIKSPADSRPFVNGNDQFLKFVMHRLNYSAGTVMIRKTAFDRVGDYHEGILVEDFEWWMRACRKLNIKFVDAKWLFYRRHPTNFVQTPAGALKAVKSHYTVAKELGFLYGSLFLITSISNLVLWESTAGRKRRYWFILLIPVLFWNVRFIKGVLISLFGYSKMATLKNSLRRHRKS